MRRFILLTIFSCIGLFAEAQQAKRADSLLQVVKTAPDSLKAEIYLDLALAFRNNDVKKAYQYGRLALNMAKEGEVNKTLSDAYNILGSIYTSLGDYENANIHLHESLKLNELLGRKRGIANSANSLGILYFNQKDYDNALKYYNKALLITDTTNYKGGYATFSLNVGEIYQVQGQYDLSIPLLMNSLRIFKEVEDDEGLAYCYGILSRINYAKGNYDKALEQANTALKYFLIDQNDIGKAEYGILIASIYQAQGDFSMAEIHAQSALEMAKELSSLQWMMRSHEKLAELYELNELYQKAYFHIDTAKELRTELLDEKVQQQIQNFRIIYETDNLIQENKLLKINSQLDEKEITEQKAISITTAIVLLAMLIFAYYIYRQNKSKQRKNMLLKVQNEEIRQQREEILTQAEGLKYINKQISLKNELIEKKNKDITDSLNYAKRIQTALLPFEDRINKTLPQHFILHQPKDIVSGDFYWFHDFEEEAIIVVADCTGHGIPGAFMSFIGHDLLNYICNIKRVTNPTLILSEMKKSVITMLRQEKNDNRDGLDISICVWHKKENKVTFAGANHSLIYIQDGQLNQLKGDRTTIGWDPLKEIKDFTQHEVPINKDTEFYLYTDGYIDQFGGPANKKFMLSPFKELLLKNHLKQMSTQKEILDAALKDWMRQQEQIDDILVFGFRLFD